jgi:hypothetical protein
MLADMLVEERLVNEVLDRTDGDGAYLAIRQPAVLRYLARLGDGDAFGVAFFHADGIVRAVEATLGLPPPRLTRRDLERGEERQERLAERQPALVQLIAAVTADPPLLLDRGERESVGRMLTALVAALDEVAFGRPM